ncbi:MFS transporter [Caenispirillum bisanense]|uniref:MFS transporter n=1 Tax=Caenispirillum bisanense TaxID=414052 RepID=UPI0031D8DA79
MGGKTTATAAAPAAGPVRRDDIAPWVPWVMWGFGALFYCYGFFQRVAPSVMVGELMRDFAVGAAITGTLSSLYFYTYAGLQIPVGLVLDRFGPRRVLAAAAVVSCLGSAGFAFADSLTLAYVGRALIGVGAAVTWVAALTLAGNWFPPRRFALISGLTMALGMAGAVGGQAPLAAAVTAVGWRGTMIGAAVFAAVLGVAAWLIVRDRPGADARSRPQAAEHGFSAGLSAALRRRQIWVIGLFGAMTSAPMLAFAGLWGVPYMMRLYDMSRPEAAVMTSIMLVGWGFGSPFFGWLTDAIGRRRLPMMLSSGGSLACTLTWLYGGLPLAALYPLLFLTGLFAGGIVLTFATARENAPGWASGATLGVVNMAVMASGGIFQPLIGWFLDLAWTGETAGGARLYSVEAWRSAMAVLPVCNALALTAALLVRETHCRPHGEAAAAA